MQLRAAEDGRVLMELERVEIAPLRKLGWRAPEPFIAKGRDGTTDIWGVIVKPAAFDPRKKYPVIKNIYAGPHASFAPKFFAAYNGMMALAELGFDVERGIVPGWMAVIIVGREIAVTGFRAIAASQGHTIPAFALGKIKMILETVTICILILGPAILGKLYLLSRWGLWLIIIAAVGSAAEYYIRFGPKVLSSDT